jgi:hypothetical protein
VTETTADPFILHRENHDYLAGRSHKVYTHEGFTSAGLLIAIFLIGSGVVGVTCVALGTVEGPPAMALLGSAAVAGAGLWVLHRVRLLWRLADEGTLLPGRILSSTGEEYEDGYCIRIEYLVVSPESRACRGKSHTFRDDLRGML